MTAAPEVPELVRVSVRPAENPVGHVNVVPVLVVVNSAAARAVFVTEICADWDEDPKMPKTKPPIATDAMRVTAMISTVAMIGEMAFLWLCFPYGIFIGEFSGRSLVFESWELLVWFWNPYVIKYRAVRATRQ